MTAGYDSVTLRGAQISGLVDHLMWDVPGMKTDSCFRLKEIFVI